MIVRVTFKDPDNDMRDAIMASLNALTKPDNVSEEEWAGVLLSRAEKIEADIVEKWVEFGEYLVVDFNTEKHTAKMVQNG